MAFDVALVFALIVLNAAFAGTELALVSLREGQLRRLEGESGRGRRVASLARDPNRFLATIQIGITVSGFLASATVAVSLAEPLVEPLGFLGRAAEPAAVVVMTLVLTFFTLVLGELAPKRVALQRAERWALIAARPLSALNLLTRPVVWLLARSTDVAVRIMGVDPRAQREHITQQEVLDLVGAVVLSPLQRQIIAGAFDIAERAVRDVLVPRPRVVAVQRDTPAGEAIDLLRSSGYSRAPVFTDDLDDASTVVHLRDLVGREGPAGAVSRPALVVPETLGALETLRQLQVGRQSLAIVVNEHGSTEGIVTVEDLLEELVGEIYDESDRDVRGAEHRPDGSIVIAGSFPMHDLVDLGVDLPESDDYSTIAGLVLDHLGHLPGRGEAVVVKEWKVEVLATARRAITRVRLVPQRPASPDHNGRA